VTAVITALALSVVIGMTALSVEYGNALVTRTETQRVADMASYSAAIAYTLQSGDQNVRRAAAINAASDIAELNGIASERVSLNFEQSDGLQTDSLIHAIIESTQPLALARVINTEQTLNISVLSVAQIGNANSSACALALNPSGAGLVLSGSGAISAIGCSVASNAAVRINNCYGNNSAAIIAETIYYNVLDFPNPQSCPAPIQNSDGDAPNLVEKQTEDPLSGDPRLELAQQEILATKSLVQPASGPDLTIVGSWENPATRANIEAVGCTGQYSQSTWTITCPGSNLNLGRLDLQSGSAIVQFQGGQGSYSIANGINVNGNAHLSFAPGNFNIGSNSGDAISLSGSATLSLGSSGANVNNINVHGSIETAGNSCIVFGAATRHRILGNIDIGGAAVFGQGPYAIDGFLNLSRGGNRVCDGVTTTARGIGVTFIVSGESTCANAVAICGSGGQANMRFESPASGSFKDMLMIVPTQSTGQRGIHLTGGAQGTVISGVVYAPQGRLRIDGAASILPTDGGCIQLIAAEINISGSGNASLGDCLGEDVGGVGTEVRLVR